MPKIIRINGISHPGLIPYFSLTDHRLREPAEGSRPLIIVESPKVIKTALEKGVKPVSLLTLEKHIKGDASEVISMLPDTTEIFIGNSDLLKEITGFKLTRGVLCAMERPSSPETGEILLNSKRICIIQDVNNTTNTGSIFRSAAALGIDGILLSKGSCDPYNRRAVRVSMGSVFQIPWCETEDPIGKAKEAGFTVAGMALTSSAVPLDSVKIGADIPLAIVLGTEGDGLPENELQKIDLKVVIPMHYTVDSLNVGTAAGIAFWHFRR